MKIYFDKLSCFNRISEPCSLAVPFKKGELFANCEIAVFDNDLMLPSQTKFTAFWEDGSVKWALVDFFATLPGNESKTLEARLVERADKKGIHIEKTDKLLIVDNGAIKLCLNNSGDIFEGIESDSLSLTREDISGVTLNNEFVAKITEPWEIVENGEVTALLQAKGKHFKGDDTCLDFTVSIRVYNNKDWFKLEYRYLNDEKQEYIDINSLELGIRVKDKKERYFATSNYKTTFHTEVDNVLIDADYLMADANEHIPEVFYGTLLGEVENEKGGICATIYQAYQNFPKALACDNDNLSIQLVPASSKGIRLYRGMAKSETVFIHCHNGLSKEELNFRSLQFQMPDKPYVDAQVYAESGVFPDVFLDKKDLCVTVENSFTYRFDGRGRAYGILNWGDALDSHYTAQGRGNGAVVWANSEYDFPHVAMLMYARNPERRILDGLLVAAKHWMEVDICHSSDDEYRLNGMVTHSAHHISGSVDISHEWVEGLLDYYHMTGDKYAYDCAIGVGMNIVKRLSLPKYHQRGNINARETGWALRALVALYQETNDEFWLKDAEFIVDHFRQWKQTYNGWLAPYTDHTTIRVPFMISIAIVSLMKYYELRPNEEIKQMIIDAAEDLVENSLMDNGLFYYKELPSLNRNATNPIILEALSYAYELSGDIRLLKAGENTFLGNVCIGSMFSSKKMAQEDAIILSTAGTKVVAQPFFPILKYYVTCTRAGIKFDIKY